MNFSPDDLDDVLWDGNRRLLFSEYADNKMNVGVALPLFERLPISLVDLELESRDGRPADRNAILPINRNPSTQATRQGR
ncbi:hypothetical protein QA648_35065 (plasmid) [Rhizobium sp. CB3171]|uniref:hypothetical protein n=1 Tax=Rhizobium sp. CB3171 TaxID=3039157 RepID=UPI0024B19BEE|nr:hypothetical protein [Rhizobium sp. CB3171]WFU07129.1 hypothetical protein QA648_35065 [Rhizobium sp. CB3171]